MNQQLNILPARSPFDEYLEWHNNWQKNGIDPNRPEPEKPADYFNYLEWNRYYVEKGVEPRAFNPGTRDWSEEYLAWLKFKREKAEPILQRLIEDKKLENPYINMGHICAWVDSSVCNFLEQCGFIWDGCKQEWEECDD